MEVGHGQGEVEHADRTWHCVGILRAGTAVDPRDDSSFSFIISNIDKTTYLLPQLAESIPLQTSPVQIRL